MFESSRWHSLLLVRELPRASARALESTGQIGQIKLGKSLIDLLIDRYDQQHTQHTAMIEMKSNGERERGGHTTRLYITLDIDSTLLVCVCLLEAECDHCTYIQNEEEEEDNLEKGCGGGEGIHHGDAYAIVSVVCV